MVAETGKAGIILASHLIGHLELALRPVTHDLAAGSAGDHHVGGLVPVLNVGAVCHFTGIGHGLEDLRHLRSLGCIDILFQVDLLPQVKPADTDLHGAEQQVRLPGLLPEGERLDAGFAQFRRRGDEFIPVGRNRNAGLFIGGMGQPQPLRRVDVHRNAIDPAIERAAVEQARRIDDVLPAFLLGQFGQVEHQAGLDQLFGLTAMVELGGGHRIAAGDARDHDGTGGAAAAGEGAVDPLVAGGVERLGKFGNGCGFAAGRPPVSDFKVHGLGSRRKCQQRCTGKK